MTRVRAHGSGPGPLPFQAVISGVFESAHRNGAPGDQDATEIWSIEFRISAWTSGEIGAEPADSAEAA